MNSSGTKEEDMVVPKAIETARLEYAAKEELDAVENLRAATLISDGSPVKIIDDNVEDSDCKIMNFRADCSSTSLAARSMPQC